MSAIKGKNTKPEIQLRSLLHSLGFRFRLHDKKLPGKPDIVLPKYKTAIFVNGCFWHGHENCKHFRLPKTRTEWWKEKIRKTKICDKTKSQSLRDLGWRVITVWECENLNEASQNIAEKLKSAPHVSTS